MLSSYRIGVQYNLNAFKNANIALLKHLPYY